MKDEDQDEIFVFWVRVVGIAIIIYLLAESIQLTYY